MIFAGLLRKLCAKWCDDRDGSIATALLSEGGDLLSAEPAVRIRELGAIAAGDAALREELGRLPWTRLRGRIAANPRFAEALDDYLKRFGERCMEELKLESLTLAEDPGSLYATIGEIARADAPKDPVPTAARGPGGGPAAEARAGIRRHLRFHPLRSALLGWVARHARARLVDREAMRFERARVFGRVRGIVLELGRRLHAARVLGDPREVFHLELGELLGFVEGTGSSAELRSLAAVRLREFERNLRETPPDARFETRGMVFHGHRYRVRREPSAEPGAESRTGIGSSAGRVRGRVRVVTDPRASGLLGGEILVAERTDPGWVLLFPVAAGLVVERGSLLSHASIVARELGLPAVVGVPGATTWLRTGDEIEIDGASGEVRRLRKGD